MDRSLNYPFNGEENYDDFDYGDEDLSELFDEEKFPCLVCGLIVVKDIKYQGQEGTKCNGESSAPPAVHRQQVVGDGIGDDSVFQWFLKSFRVDIVTNMKHVIVGRGWDGVDGDILRCCDKCRVGLIRIMELQKELDGLGDKVDRGLEKKIYFGLEEVKSKMGGFEDAFQINGIYKKDQRIKLVRDQVSKCVLENPEHQHGKDGRSSLKKPDNGGGKKPLRTKGIPVRSDINVSLETANADASMISSEPPYETPTCSKYITANKAKIMVQGKPNNPTSTNMGRKPSQKKKKSTSPLATNEPSKQNKKENRKNATSQTPPEMRKSKENQTKSPIPKTVNGHKLDSNASIKANCAVAIKSVRNSSDISSELSSEIPTSSTQIPAELPKELIQKKVSNQKVAKTVKKPSQKKSTANLSGKRNTEKIVEKVNCRKPAKQSDNQSSLRPLGDPDVQTARVPTLTLETLQQTGNDPPLIPNTSGTITELSSEASASSNIVAEFCKEVVQKKASNQKPTSKVGSKVSEKVTTHMSLKMNRKINLEKSNGQKSVLQVEKVVQSQVVSSRTSPKTKQNADMLMARKSIESVSSIHQAIIDPHHDTHSPDTSPELSFEIPTSSKQITTEVSKQVIQKKVSSQNGAKAVVETLQQNATSRSSLGTKITMEKVRQAEEVTIGTSPEIKPSLTKTPIPPRSQKIRNTAEKPDTKDNHDINSRRFDDNLDDDECSNDCQLILEPNKITSAPQLNGANVICTGNGSDDDNDSENDRDLASEDKNEEENLDKDETCNNTSSEDELDHGNSRTFQPFNHSGNTVDKKNSSRKPVKPALEKVHTHISPQRDVDVTDIDYASSENDTSHVNNKNKGNKRPIMKHKENESGNTITYGHIKFSFLKENMDKVSCSSCKSLVTLRKESMHLHVLRCVHKEDSTTIPKINPEKVNGQKSAKQLGKSVQKKGASRTSPKIKQNLMNARTSKRSRQTRNNIADDSDDDDINNGRQKNKQARKPQRKRRRVNYADNVSDDDERGGNLSSEDTNDETNLDDDESASSLSSDDDQCTNNSSTSSDDNHHYYECSSSSATSSDDDDCSNTSTSSEDEQDDRYSEVDHVAHCSKTVRKNIRSQTSARKGKKNGHKYFAGTTSIDRASLKNTTIRFHTLKCRRNPYLCALCPYKTGVKSELDRHFKLAHKVYKKLNCKECGKRFTSKLELKRHEGRRHGGKKAGKPKRGQQGGKKRFDSQSGMRKRKDSGRRKIRPEPWECKKCKKVYSRKPSSKMHICSTLAIREWRCGVNGCGEGFETKKRLKLHHKYFHD